MPETLQMETSKDARVLDALLSDQFSAKLDALAKTKAEEYQANTPSSGGQL